MANVKMITTALNSYFVNNKIMIGSEIPTDGNYNVGDIMIKENQVAGDAIGWVCVTGGSPATWSEFGKQPVIEDGSVNIAKLADDVKLKLALIDAVNVSIKSVRSDIDDLQTDIETLTSDVENINTVIEEKVGENIGDLTGLYTEDKSNLVNAINELDIECANLNGYIEDVEEVAYGNKYDIEVINSDIGDKTNLSTTDKSNLVAAINEVFQSGVNVKENLVGALTSKGVICSTSNTFDELIEMIENLSNSPFADWAKANTWLLTGTCKAMPAKSYQLTAQAYKNKIYCIGGVGTTTANRVYDIKTNTWATLANMPTGRYGLDSTIIGSSIYCIGGYNNLTTNQVYNINTNTWVTMAAMPTGREYMTVEAVGDIIYAIGGSGSSSYLKTNEAYNTGTNTWTTKTAMTVAKYGHKSGVIGNNIYCVGGYTGSYVKTNYCYDTITNTWTTKKALSGNRSEGCCVEANGKLYFMFGRSASTTYTRNTYCYDPVADTWTTMTASTGVTSYGRAAAHSNGLIFAFGGSNGSALSAVECYII